MLNRLEKEYKAIKKRAATIQKQTDTYLIKQQFEIDKCIKRLDVIANKLKDI